MTTRKRTAAETILLAAAQFAGQFTKWELAVAAWKLDPERFGMRGFERQHPDTNRVMMEIVGNKSSSPLRRGQIESVSPSVYRLTAKGRDGVALCRGKDSIELATAAAMQDQDRAALCYDSVAALMTATFQRWQDNPEEPRLLAEARASLGTWKTPNNAASAALGSLDWMARNGVEYLVLIGSKNVKPIHARDVAALNDYLTALEYRFPQLAPKRTARA